MSKHKKRDKAPKAKKSGTERILELLSDGRLHSHTELYKLHCIAHSRVAELRRRGHTINCQRVGDEYLYRLERAA